MKRVRILQVSVEITAALDDSETDSLTPLRTQAVAYAAQDWPLFDLEHTRQLIEQKVLGELSQLSRPGAVEVDAGAPGPIVD